MRTKTKWLRLVGLASSSLALVHCVGDEPTTGGDDAGGGDSGTPDNFVPPSDSGSVDSGVDAGACAPGVSPCIVQIAGGGQTFCARDEQGNVYCWGNNSDGQLGADPMTTPFSATPIKVPLAKIAIGIDVGGPRNATDLGVSVVCARVTAALGTPSTIACWGANRYGQLGVAPDAGPHFDTGGGAYNFTPTEVPGISSSTFISVSGTHVCSISSSGVAFCWGDNSNGELARTSTNTFDPTPAAISVAGFASPTIDAIATGYQHTCTMNGSNGDKVGCAGQNVVGQLGNGDASAPGDSNTSSQINGVPGPVKGLFISSQGNSTCAVTTANALSCWGENGNSDLGTGAASPDIPTPVTPVGLSGATPVRGVQSGFDHTCATLSVPADPDSGVRENVYCWGRNVNGQTGAYTDGGPTYAPTPVRGLPDYATAIASGAQASCALVNGGTVWCWGENYVGELGDRGDGGTDGLPLPPGQVHF